MNITYARARLWTGILGVGFHVLLATTLLIADVPARWLTSVGGDLIADFSTLCTGLLAVALLVLPLDLLGGLWIPRRFDRSHPTGAQFFLRWMRGVLTVVTLSAASGTVLLAVGRWAGEGAAIAAFALISALLLLSQEPIARLVGGLRRSRQSSGGHGDDVILLEGDDPGFCGGFAGWSNSLVVPAAWKHTLKPPALSVLLDRRRQLAQAGAWRFGALTALAWNTVGFAVALLLPGAGIGNLAQLITTALGFTLWTFLGLLILPTPSRRATLTADQLVARDPETVTQLTDAISQLDALQDAEPERSRGIESVFHPVPAAGRRLRDLAAPSASSASAWHLARTALFLSYAGLSLLPRSVHCNAGRPELWVYLPTDG